MTLTLVLLALLASAAPAPARDPKIVIVVIDGIRALEWEGKARDDAGRAVRAETLFPNLLALKRRGVLLRRMTVSNPVGISLPAYSDIFAGRRQDAILKNPKPGDTFHSQYPTLFQAVQKGLGLGPDGIAIHSSWWAMCGIAATEGDPAEFYKSCGWKKGAYVKPEAYEGSRADVDTFLELARELPKRHPRLVFVHLGDADEEAHTHEGVFNKTGLHYGIFKYHQALREDDYHVGRIWKLLQSDPYYKDSTYLIVTTDHGRDNWPDPDQWANHGRCVRRHGAKELCSGCRKIFAVAVGPGVKRAVVDEPYSHVDLAPTAARILGVELPGATGKVIPEIYRITVPTRPGRK